MVVGISGVAGCSSVAEYFAPSDAQLTSMAAQAWRDTKNKTPISRDQQATARLRTVGVRIASAANRPNDPWEFVVFDGPEKNAFVLPGGKVGFYKGLLDFCASDDQVAAVLGHEVAHVTKRHAALRIGEKQAEAMTLGIVGGFVGGTQMDAGQQRFIMQVFGAGANIFGALPFSREHESEADRVGVDYMHTAGFDVRESVTLWNRMNTSSGGRPPEVLSTHPDPARRAQELRGYINAKGYATI
jgi:predicted Zn-dependent protease